MKKLRFKVLKSGAHLFLVLLLSSFLISCAGSTPESGQSADLIKTEVQFLPESGKTNFQPETDASDDSFSGTENSKDDPSAEIPQQVGSGSAHPADLSQIPPYSGKPFFVLNENIPNFSEDELKSIGYESYSDLDLLGRTGMAIASLGKDTMPKEGEKRGSISAIKPSGWIQASYDHISGKYLYNRCHLIGWQLSAENANKKNLITGTKYLNVNGMLPFENMIADYINEIGNHVAYRITPIYEGENLLASGIEMEAYSVEDRGEGILFHVFCYNVQPGVKIDYASGSSTLDPSASASPNQTAPTTTTAPPISTQKAEILSPSAQSTVFITQTGKRYHSTRTCSGLSNAKAIYESNLSAAQNSGLTPCSKCY